MPATAHSKQPSATDADAGVTLEALHWRQIDFRGYRRSDGLFEMHARILDTKPFAFTLPSDARTVDPDEPIHDLGALVVYDADLVIRAVRSTPKAWPYAPCDHGGDVLQAMVGVRIGPGWATEVRKRLPSADTCTHLREIFISLASAVMQTMVPFRLHALEAVDASGRPTKIDSCYAYGASREMVLQRWPAFHRPAAVPDSAPQDGDPS